MGHMGVRETANVTLDRACMPECMRKHSQKRQGWEQPLACMLTSKSILKSYSSSSNAILRIAATYIIIARLIRGVFVAGGHLHPSGWCGSHLHSGAHTRQYHEGKRMPSWIGALGCVIHNAKESVMLIKLTF